MPLPHRLLATWLAAAPATGLALALTLGAAAAQARITRISIDEVKPLAPLPGQSIAYEQLAGRAFGELDPALPQNALIQDIRLGLDADGKARYVASFVLTRPVNPAQASGLLWHDVPNRGGPLLPAPAERAAGDLHLASAWQGDNAGSASTGTLVRPAMQVDGRHWLQLPVARQADGRPITGQVFGRIVNRSGPGSQPLIVQTNPVPYQPASLDTRAARLVSRLGERTDGRVIGEAVVAPEDWAWARCSADNPFPGTPDPTQVCLKGGFEANKLYMVSFTAQNPPVLGMGFAAWRDLAHWLRTAQADDQGTPNPVAGQVRHSIGRGVSQSGNFLRGWLHLGFNQAEDGRQVHDGLWPIIAGRRIALNFRWAQPDGVLELYQAGSEGPQWWSRQPDAVRGLPAGGLLVRCEATRTCPKVVEHFGSAEVWALKLSPAWVGTDGARDLPIPPNVRSYYIASSGHGGGAGGFDTSLPGVGLPASGVACPGNNFGTGVLPANPVPHTHTVNALRAHFRRWVMQDVAPPPSVLPTLAGTLQADGNRRPDLVPANKQAMGFPTLPGLRATVPEADFIMPVLDYDWGPDFKPMDASGVPSLAPPSIKRAIRMLVPRVDADGNEVGGLPVVLTDAPLGTYLGWNITAGGARPFHAGQICNYAGGMLPFAKTRAEREAAGDPRLSLQERYGDHAGYVAAVEKAAARAQAAGFLLPEDARALVDQARASQVLR